MASKSRIVASVEGGMMLSALDFARRIEAGTLTPRAAVELCAEAIARATSEVAAFVALDLEARAVQPKRRASRPRRSTACR